MPAPARDLAWWLTRGVIAAAAFAVTWFAVQGGEYGTLDLVRQYKQRTALERRIAALQREVDSLEAEKKRVKTDPATQERIAREEFGMVRGEKELLYRFAPRPDTSP